MSRPQNEHLRLRNKVTKSNQKIQSNPIRSIDRHSTTTTTTSNKKYKKKMFPIVFVVVVVVVLGTWIANVRGVEEIYSEPYSAQFSYRDQAKIYHKQALDLANRQQYDLSLAYFRLAVRYDPSNPFFWSDLGVTEMRVHQWDKARQRFLKALELDPHYELAKKNIVELNNYAVNSGRADWDDVPSSSQLRLSTDHLASPQHDVTPPRQLYRSEYFKIIYPLRYLFVWNAWQAIHGSTTTSEALFQEQLNNGLLEGQWSAGQSDDIILIKFISSLIIYRYYFTV
jgi:tetratricopeptide (TPR) repeat protein